MRLLVIAGMPRAGTTFLYHNFQRHPEVFVAFRKEINYWNVHFDQPESGYRALFAEAAAHQICCDGSPLCFMDSAAEGRIADFDGEWKVIVSVRDPIDWSLSFYAQIQSYTYNMPPYSEFVRGYDFEVAKKTQHLTFLHDFVPRRIEELCRTLGDRLLIFPATALKRDPRRALNRIEDFLGLSRHFGDDNFDRRRINASGRKNIRWLSRLLNREPLIALIYKVFPRSLIVGVRRRLDALEATGARSRQYPHRPEDVALCRRLFAGQQRWVDDFFASHEFQLGSGAPLPPAGGVSAPDGRDNGR